MKSTSVIIFAAVLLTIGVLAQVSHDEASVGLLQYEMQVTMKTGIATGLPTDDELPSCPAGPAGCVPASATLPPKAETAHTSSFALNCMSALDVIAFFAAVIAVKYLSQHARTGKKASAAPPVPLVTPPTWQALARAVQAGDLATCESLLARGGINLAEADAWDCTVLHAAAANGSVSIAQRLVDRGAAVDARDAWDETPLHFAARAGHAKMCEFLLARGADMDRINAQDWTPLVLAARSGKEEVCRILLDKGAGTAGLPDSDIPQLLQSLLVERVFLGGGPKDQDDTAAENKELNASAEGTWTDSWDGY